METRYIYTENNYPAEIIEVTQDGELDEIAEKLIESNTIDCYCFFKDGKKLEDSDFKKLSEIGVSAFIGVVARWGSVEELYAFNVTEVEMRNSHHLWQLQ